MDRDNKFIDRAMKVKNRPTWITLEEAAIFIRDWEKVCEAVKRYKNIGKIPIVPRLKG